MAVTFGISHGQFSLCRQCISGLSFRAMEAAFYLLLVVGHLGSFDVLYFHIYKCTLARRPECHTRSLVAHHSPSHLRMPVSSCRESPLSWLGVCSSWLLYSPSDVYVAWSDVWEETASRRSQGGLPRGEYFMHIVLSLLVGSYLLLVLQTVWPDRLLSLSIIVQPPHVPAIAPALHECDGRDRADGVYL